MASLDNPLNVASWGPVFWTSSWYFRRHHPPLPLLFGHFTTVHPCSLAAHPTLSLISITCQTRLSTYPPDDAWLGEKWEEHWTGSRGSWKRVLGIRAPHHFKFLCWLTSWKNCKCLEETAWKQDDKAGPEGSQSKWLQSPPNAQDPQLHLGGHIQGSLPIFMEQGWLPVYVLVLQVL